MRKIISKQEREKKKKTNQYIIGGVLILVMLISTLGYAFQGGKKEDSSQIIYKNYKFANQNGFWITQIGNYNFAFRYNPEEIEKINGDVNYINSYSGKPLYIQSENSDATLEIYSNLNKIVQRIQPACLEKEGCEENIPIKNCEENFIIIRGSENNNIIQNDSCVFIEGKYENLTMLTDEFLLKIIGID